MHVGVEQQLWTADGAFGSVVLRTGDVVATILKTAEDQQADLIAMPTAGHHGFFDALRKGG